MTETLVVFVVLAILVIIVIAKTAVVVPQQSAYVVERLGKYRATLHAGFHLLMPFFDAVRYKHSLKEAAIDIPEQVCITRDNVQVHVDGVIYLKELDPQRASYGVADYLFAISQLAQTTLRSEIGRIDLDRTFEERTHVNSQVVNELDKASEPWGIKVLRYEIKNITPPKDVLAAMEKQMRAEREKRAAILTSAGERDSMINTAEGQKQQVIKASEANKQQQINEAEGAAAAILAIATATAEGIRRVAEATQVAGGHEAVQLRIAEQYIQKFGELANATDTTMIVPAGVADVAGMVATAMGVIQRRPPNGGPATATPTPPHRASRPLSRAPRRDCLAPMRSVCAARRGRVEPSEPRRRIGVEWSVRRGVPRGHRTAHWLPRNRDGRGPARRGGPASRHRPRSPGSPRPPPAGRCPLDVLGVAEPRAPSLTAPRRPNSTFSSARPDVRLQAGISVARGQVGDPVNLDASYLPRARTHEVVDHQ